MRRGKTDDIRLCPTCPLMAFLPSVKRRSWTKEPLPESSVKVCSALRAYGRRVGAPMCPHFPKSESMARYIFGKPKKRGKK